MILVITPETIIPNEPEIINQMFHEGLDLLHIRKPSINREEMTGFINSIDDSFSAQLILHTHYEVGKDYNISRFHFREEDRRQGKYKPWMTENIISTSVHDIAAYNMLEKEWEYAFISPLFPSISKKGYGADSRVMNDVRQRNNPEVKLIGLGGIDADHIHEAFEAGVDGVALLGAIWESNEPLKVFKECRKNIPSL